MKDKITKKFEAINQVEVGIVKRLDMKEESN